jgi:hypothetical protein
MASLREPFTREHFANAALIDTEMGSDVMLKVPLQASRPYFNGIAQS